jgi:hypothetical protein
MAQPTGTDPSQEMMRQIIGIFDEYTSKQNSKNVTRAMKRMPNKCSGMVPRLRSVTPLSKPNGGGKRSTSTPLSSPSRPRPSCSSFASMRKVTPRPALHRSASSNSSSGSTDVVIEPRPAGALAAIQRPFGQDRRIEARFGNRLRSQLPPLSSRTCSIGSRPGLWPTIPQGHTTSRRSLAPSSWMDLRPSWGWDDAANRNLQYGTRLRLLHMCKPCAEGQLPTGEKRSE